MQFLRLNSGTGAGSGPTISIGPCLDTTGAEYTGLVIADLTLTKNGASAAMAANATLTATSNGHYDLVMIGNNPDTLGRLRVRCNKSGYQFPPLEFMVLPAMIYDSLVAGSDRLDANVTHVNDVAASAVTTIGTHLGTAGASTAQTGDNYAITNNATYGLSAMLDQLRLRSAGKEWFVRSTGSDFNVGSREAPFLTAAGAESAANDGDTIHFIGTTTVTGTWTPTKRLNITGDKGAIFGSTAQATTLQISSLADVHIYGPLTIRNTSSAGGPDLSALNITGSNNVSVERVTCTNNNNTAGLTVYNSTGVVLNRVIANGKSAGIRNYGSIIRSSQCKATGGDHGGYTDSGTIAEQSYGNVAWLSELDWFIGTTSAASAVTVWSEPHCAGFFFESHQSGAVDVLHFVSPIFECTTTNASFADKVGGLMGEQTSGISLGYAKLEGGRTVVTNANTSGTTYHLRANTGSTIQAINHTHDSTKNNGTVQVLDGDIGATKTAAVTVNAKIGTPATTLAADIAGIEAGGGVKPKKNTALPNFQFYMEKSNGTPATGKSITAQRSIDGGSFSNCTNSVTEKSDGWYSTNLAAADMNGDDIAFKFTGSGCKQRNIKILTQP